MCKIIIISEWTVQRLCTMATAPHLFKMCLRWGQRGQLYNTVNQVIRVIVTMVMSRSVVMEMMLSTVQ